ncbi:unnamed protein product [Nippostrongylus brasiliensis]|uniref:Transmembrane protein n=1 Tax=Nippostrongylus brasiliensis TaxID=27835 RepID=A0A0N4Y0K9_NIPBR|nr:unnamed protein product [Nippostrongylus brasiliensis]
MAHNEPFTQTRVKHSARTSFGLGVGFCRSVIGIDVFLFWAESLGVRGFLQLVLYRRFRRWIVSHHPLSLPGCLILYLNVARLDAASVATRHCLLSAAVTSLRCEAYDVIFQRI